MKKRNSMFLAAMLAIAITTTGCFGSFGLTQKVYNFNKGVGDEPVQTLVMWGLLIVPVYEVSFAVDFLILNTLEHWTGNNPVASIKNQSIQLPNGEEVSIIKKDKQFYINCSQGEFLLEYDKSNQTWAVSQNGTIFQTYQLGKNGKLIRHSDNESKILN